MANRRTTLVDAGFELLRELRFQDLLGAVDVARVAQRAGVTEGSFFHHFPSRAHYADAVAASYQERWKDGQERIVGLLEGIAGELDSLGPVSEVARAEWEMLSNSGISEARMLLWAARRQPLSGRNARSSGELLGGLYSGLTDAVLPRYRRIMAALGRAPMPPFTDRDVVVAITALQEGLHLRCGVEPAAAPPELYQRLLSVLLLSITRPNRDNRRLEDLERELAADLAAPVRAQPAGTWRHIIAAAATLFEDRHPDKVSVSEVAEAAEVSPSTVYHHFGTVRAVAAATFLRHQPELEELSARPLAEDETPEHRIEEVLLRLAEVAMANPGVTEALVGQILAEESRADRSGRRSIGGAFRLTDLVSSHTRELRVRGRLRRRVDSRALAAALTTMVMLWSLTRRGESAERIVDDAVDLVLNGALARPGEGAPA